MSAVNRLPPLNGLRAFESAARHLNLRAAAEELNVTPSAISHQIRGIEAALGVSLFRRANKRLALTDDGRSLLPGLSEGFGRIASAVGNLRDNQDQGVLTVSMVSTFAMRWFMPRLSRFQQKHPEIEIRISTTMRPVDFEREDIDAAIRNGAGDWPGMRCDRLFNVETVPVCSPDLPGTGPPLQRPEDLHGHILLHSAARPGEWAQWFEHCGIPSDKAARKLTFESTNFSLAAAIKGLGVAIADRHIVEEDVESGRLVIPFEHPMQLPEAYFLVCPERQALKPKMAHFREWLLSETPE
ncbi:MAG: transcriptional regulator GcvA [Rhodospirillaceae bacterium]|nr:transcriptional regulator GcvA [Rhodospirillaceae bacterium]